MRYMPEVYATTLITNTQEKEADFEKPIKMFLYTFMTLFNFHPVN